MYLLFVLRPLRCLSVCLSRVPLFACFSCLISADIRVVFPLQQSDLLIAVTNPRDTATVILARWTEITVGLVLVRCIDSSALLADSSYR